MMGFDDAMHNRQTQPRPGAFGCIQQRRERPLLLLLAHPFAGIFELNENKRRLLRVHSFRGNRQCAAARHRFSRVQD